MSLYNRIGSLIWTTDLSQGLRRTSTHLCWGAIWLRAESTSGRSIFYEFKTYWTATTTVCGEGHIENPGFLCWNQVGRSIFYEFNTYRTATTAACGEGHVKNPDLNWDRSDVAITIGFTYWSAMTWHAGRGMWKSWAHLLRSDVAITIGFTFWAAATQHAGKGHV